MNGWSSAELGKVAPVEGSKQSIDTENVWLLNLDMVESNTGEILDHVYIPTESVSSSTCRFDTSHVLYSKLRPYLNKVVLPDRVGYATSEMLPLKPNPEYLTREYLTLFLRSPQFVSYISSKVSGAKMPRANTAVLKKTKIPIPSLDEQREIVQKVDKIITAISIKKEQLEQLDLLIKARFFEMFNDISKFESAPLSMNIEEMFIGPFGSSLKNDCFVNQCDSYCMVYEQKHAIQKTLDLPTRYVDEQKYLELKRFSIYPNDIIVSCRGTLGETYIVPENAPLGIMHPSIMKIRLKENIYNPIFFNQLLINYMSTCGEGRGSGVKMAITAKLLGKEEFIVPSIELQNEYVAFIDKTLYSKSVLQSVIEQLWILYNALMEQYFGDFKG